MVALPRLVVAAPSTGQGKTTIATGLMAALRTAGLEVSGHKVGPDYVDPGSHALATGRPGRNLDPHLAGEQRVVPLLLHGANTPVAADIAIIEGVMGLYDGRVGTDGFGSTAHVARLTSSPVVLVLDVRRLSRSAGAIVAGMAGYDPELVIAGVVLNRAGSSRNVTEIIRAIDRTGIPVLGVLPDDDRLGTAPIELGLAPRAERDICLASIERIGEHVARHLDLDAVLTAAQAAPELAGQQWNPSVQVRPPSGGGGPAPVVAVPEGSAFTFRYRETEELLVAAGCRVVTFDPFVDASLPEGTQGIYLGGGFPEGCAGDMAANRSLLRDLRAAVDSGIPTVAEGSGMLYLAASLDGVPMAGVVPTGAVTSGRLTLRYPTATAASDSLLCLAGEQVTSHEFHRTRTTHVAGDRPAWLVDGEATGFASDTWHASFLHVHWAGHPRLAQRFADAVHAATPHRPRSFVAAAVVTADADTQPADPLRHHGDTEVDAGLLDFAVNVYSGKRPDWLDRALHRSIDDCGSYPDVAPARLAVSERHGRSVTDVLVTAGAAEAFSLIARLRDWRNPVVVHPQFTEPHAALEANGHKVTAVFCRPEEGFRLAPAAVPDDADLVVVGNPTNPTGVLHPAQALRSLCRPGRLVVVDEAFMDVVPGQTQSLIGEPVDGLLVIRSLTKLWGIPGVRAGYVVGDCEVVQQLSDRQSPWSVSTSATAATVACSGRLAAADAAERTANIVRWRGLLEQGLRARGIEHIASSAPFVLARLGTGARVALRHHGIAVRRADTFPGLDAGWVRIAVRPPGMTKRLLSSFDQIRTTPGLIAPMYSATDQE